jgi:hypothetical protein
MQRERSLGLTRGVIGDWESALLRVPIFDAKPIHYILKEIFDDFLIKLYS